MTGEEQGGIYGKSSVMGVGVYARGKYNGGVNQ